MTTHRVHDDVVRGPTTFTFVTGGAAATVDRARAAAGGGDVVVGGAHVVQQYLELGLVDEVRLHVVPVLLGGGTALFARSPRYELEPAGAEPTPHAVHLTYTVQSTMRGDQR